MTLVKLYFRVSPATKEGGRIQGDGVKVLPRIKGLAALGLRNKPKVALGRRPDVGLTKLGKFKTHDAKAPIFATMSGVRWYISTIKERVAAAVEAELTASQRVNVSVSVS